MSPERRFKIPMAQGSEQLAAILQMPDRTSCGGVICCHGMLSSKESRKLSAMAEALNAVGLAVVRFDFSGNGESDPPVGRGLIPSRLQDLNTVIDHVLGEPWLEGGLGLMGSSLGGYLALLAAAERQEVQATVCWATPYDLRRIRTAFVDSEDLRRKFPSGFGVGDPLDLSELASPGCVLVIHGQRDETVPWTEGEKIYRRLSEPRRLMLFEQADHRFTDEACRDLAIRVSADWLLREGFGGDDPLMP